MLKEWNGKRYHSLNYFLRNKFGEKVFKISLDGGFSCPNRDGTISKGGCVFCSERGSEILQVIDVLLYINNLKI